MNGWAREWISASLEAGASAKRMYMYAAADDLDRSIGFYMALFDAEPSVRKSDYAKWILDGPRMNFAISRRSHEPGLHHVGIQADSDAD